MKKLILGMLALILVFSEIFFVGCGKTQDNVNFQELPEYIGYRIKDKEIFFKSGKQVYSTKTLSSSNLNNVENCNSLISLSDYSIEDLEEYDTIINTNETFELSFIIKNPKKDTIISLLIDDSIDGKNKIYSSQSEKYHIKDITTEYIENENTYYTYVTTTITSSNIEGERNIIIREIEFLRQNQNSKSKTADDVKNVKIFTKIAVESLTIECSSNSLNINETAQISVTKTPTNASLSDVKYEIINKKTSMTISNSGLVKCIANNNSEPVNIQATLDGVKSNIITIYPKMPIKSVSDFSALKDNPDGYYYLSTNIDFTNQTWTPIDIFLGHLDGNDYSIDNLTINLNSEKSAFIIENYGTIENIKFTNVNITGIDAGAICSLNYGQIKRCSVNGTVKTNNTPNDSWSQAGLISAYNCNIIEQCFVEGYVEGIGQSILGGIAGYNMSQNETKAIIKNCIAKVSCVNGNTNGSIAGNNTYTGTIENCFAISTHNLTGSSNNSNSLITNSVVIGSNSIIGNTFGNEKVENCYAYESATSDLNDKNFYTETLGWSENIWNLSNIDVLNDVFPTLK